MLRLLADAYCRIGQRHKAIEIYERWLEEEPGDPVARHLLAACSERGAPERGSDAYIEATFDEFASSFETQLGKLSYRAPAIVAALLADAGVAATKSLDVLDAGCGTGLCAPHLAPYARRLTGVDLSARMLARAREKELYDELVKAELTEYLRDHPGCFDAVVSADTLVYFGALEDAVAAARDALRPGGLLVFTLEELADAAGTPGYALQINGRYRHAREYVERVLVQAGLTPVIVRAELRMESGLPVAGVAVRAAVREPRT